MNLLRTGLTAAALLAGSGCASIVTGHNQPVSVQALSAGEAVARANCKLTNDKGTWFVRTPGSVTVNRSLSDMSVICEKSGFQPANLAVASTTKPMVMGNLIFGGVIGTAIDIGTGAAYDYPTLITVEMAADSSAAPALTPALLDRSAAGELLARPIQPTFAQGASAAASQPAAGPRLEQVQPHIYMLK